MNKCELESRSANYLGSTFKIPRLWPILLSPLPPDAGHHYFTAPNWFLPLLPLSNLHTTAKMIMLNPISNPLVGIPFYSEKKKKKLLQLPSRHSSIYPSTSLTSSPATTTTTPHVPATLVALPWMFWALCTSEPLHLLSH